MNDPAWVPYPPNGGVVPRLDNANPPWRARPGEGRSEEVKIHLRKIWVLSRAVLVPPLILSWACFIAVLHRPALASLALLAIVDLSTPPRARRDFRPRCDGTCSGSTVDRPAEAAAQPPSEGKGGLI